MIHITKKSSCCGCTACFNICPKNAISMQPDLFFCFLFCYNLLKTQEVFYITMNKEEKAKLWSSVVLAFENSKRISEEVKKPKALGDIRGVSYIYPILWRFGLIRVPEAIEKKMGKQR